eukprot:CCRYP_011549-RA/>CCRYP_011549-RA protein AED:0.06 eAED:-0.04 QI:0/0/0/1/1/1/2/0/361
MLLSKALLTLLAMAAHATAADEDSFASRPERVKWSDDMFQNGDGTGVQSIIGGEEIIPGSRPYLVPLIGKYFCVGSLVSPRAVLTTAFCVYDANEWAPPKYVEFHRHSFLNNTGVNRVYLDDTRQCDGDVVYHPEYDNDTFENDVAIVFLPDAINDITPVKLNDDPNVPISGAPLDAAGWGSTEFTFPYRSPVPHAVTLNYVPNEACTKKPYRWPDSLIKDSMMCATAEGKAGCNYDGGAPLVLGRGEPDEGPLDPVVLVGMLSFGHLRCTVSGFPTGFTRVSKVADWVKDTVCQRTGDLCKKSKSGKNSKIKKMHSTCVKVPTYAPTEFVTEVPTVTAHPITPIPTYMPTTQWPTWMPTS